MRLFKQLLFLGVFLANFIFLNCSKNDTEYYMFSEEKTQKEQVKIPYATEKELKKISLQEDVIDYKFSREMALFDLVDFYKDKPNATLSDLPVIIYNTNKQPKFYEFIIKDNNKEIGTITTFATKEAPDFTAYVLPFIRNYNEKNATIYSELYPYSSTQENNNLITSAQKIPTQEEITVREQAKEFWNAIDNPKSPEIIKTSAFIDAWNEEYIIPEFRNEALQKTRWANVCGPSALAWLYRAYYPYYKGEYYPLHGEKSKYDLTESWVNKVSLYKENNPLYKDLAEKCRVGYGIDPFKDATLPSDLKKAVYDIFPNHKLEGGMSSPLGNARRSIENNNPTILLIRKGIELHYLAGFGTKNRYNTYKLLFFKIRKVHTDSWVLVADNGATTSEHNYLPYHMNTHAILGKDFITYTLVRK